MLLEHYTINMEQIKFFSKIRIKKFTPIKGVLTSRVCVRRLLEFDGRGTTRARVGEGA